mgnify:CR=1 FL=1
MSNYSIKRRIDKSGRISVPVTLREILGIKLTDVMEVRISDNALVLRKVENPKEEAAE